MKKEHIMIFLMFCSKKQSGMLWEEMGIRSTFESETNKKGSICPISESTNAKSTPKGD
jgi:hypothetical protein